MNELLEDASTHRPLNLDPTNKQKSKLITILRRIKTQSGIEDTTYRKMYPTIALDWNGLQNQFRHQYSKIGNTRKQLFHVWRSLHFDENMEMLDTYVTFIREVAILLGYGEPQVL